MSFFISAVGSPSAVKAHVNGLVSSTNVPASLAALIAVLCDDIAADKEMNGVQVKAQGHVGGGFGSIDLKIEGVQLIFPAQPASEVAAPVAMPPTLHPADPSAAKQTIPGFAAADPGKHPAHHEVPAETAPQHPAGSMPQSAPRPGFTGVETDTAPAAGTAAPPPTAQPTPQPGEPVPTIIPAPIVPESLLPGTPATSTSV